MAHQCIPRGYWEETQMASERTFSARAGSTARTARIILMSVVLWNLTAGHIFGDSPENPAHAKPAKAALLAVPLSFEANRGQTDSRVKFLSRGDGYALFLTSNEVVFTLRTPAGVKAPPSVLRMELLGAEPNAQVSGADKLPGVANYFIGNDPKKWRSGISAYGKVKYRDIYPGVDAVFYGNQRQLEYDFVVAPGADPKQISLGLTGATPSLDIEGNVLLRLADGNLALKKPFVYQNIDGAKKTVAARYAIAGGKVRFQLGKYDHSQTLVIDPVFTYLTYLGGSGPDQIGGIQEVGQTSSPTQSLAIDSAGDVYVTGSTMSADFPLAHPYLATIKPGNYTAFVSALNPSGTALLYSTYLGGSLYTAGTSIVWDSHDNALYVVGTTNSPDFPITAGAFQPFLSPQPVNGKEGSGGNYSAYVAKFSASGQLTNSTFLGGNPQTDGFGVAADSQGRAYVVGITVYNCISAPSYQCFPTTPGAVIPAGTISSNGNGFISVFDPNLSTLLYSTLLGDPNGAPTNTSEAFGVTVDASGNFYVVGVTGSPSLPATPGAFQPKIGTSNAIPLVGFAAKFGPVSASGASLTYLTYLEATGVSFGDLPGGVVADSQGNAYIGGYTNSTTFPLTPGAYHTPCPLNGAGLCPGAFVTKLNSTGTGLVWSALVEPADYFSSIQLDAQGNVYVTGHGSGSFQAVNPVQTGLVSGGFVSKLDPTGSSLLFSSVVGAGVGNTGNSSLSGLAVDAQGSLYVAGSITDATLPTTPGVFQPSYRGGGGALGDGLIAKINLLTATPLPPTITAGGIVPVYSSSATIQPGEWVSIYGANLAAATATWTGNFPTSLGGTSVTINGKPAYLWYVSPGQINLQAPDDATTGTVTVVVTTANGSATSTVTLAQFAPSFLLLDTKHVTGIILRSNGTGAYGGGAYDIIGPTGSSLGYPTVAAKAGDSLLLFGVGFGPTSPVVLAGMAYSGAASTTKPVSVLIDNVGVIPSFAGLSGAGLVQINLVLPAGLGAGDVTLVASVNGVSTQSNVVISVQ
jgi:uncharacterized protein (TIGR03437 family)